MIHPSSDCVEKMNLFSQCKSECKECTVDSPGTVGLNCFNEEKGEGSPECKRV